MQRVPVFIGVAGECSVYSSPVLATAKVLEDGLPIAWTWLSECFNELSWLVRIVLTAAAQCLPAKNAVDVAMACSAGASCCNQLRLLHKCNQQRLCQTVLKGKQACASLRPQ